MNDVAGRWWGMAGSVFYAVAEERKKRIGVWGRAMVKPCEPWSVVWTREKSEAGDELLAAFGKQVDRGQRVMGEHQRTRSAVTRRKHQDGTGWWPADGRKNIATSCWRWFGYLHRCLSFGNGGVHLQAALHDA
jgi:hypothetical protein